MRIIKFYPACGCWKCYDCPPRYFRKVRAIVRKLIDGKLTKKIGYISKDWDADFNRHCPVCGKKAKIESP